MFTPSDQVIPDMVHCHRSQTIFGDCIDMVPYNATHDAEVVRLRNITEVRYFLHLAKPANLDGQSLWRVGYEDRHDDIMWLLRDKSGCFCGTNRLYNINNKSAEKGSQIVDPNFARVLPAALESEVRIIDMAFKVFGVQEVIATIRQDNERVKSMNVRLGFIRDRELNIRGVEYWRYVLPRRSWNPNPFKAILAQWSRRFS